MRINNLVKSLETITKDVKLSYGLGYEAVIERYLSSNHAIILNWNGINSYQKYQNEADFEYSYSLYYKFPKKGDVLDKIETLTDLLLETKFLDNNDLYRYIDFDSVTPVEDTEIYLVIQIDLTIR
jgi:hypothetical protein